MLGCLFGCEDHEHPVLAILHSLHKLNEDQEKIMADIATLGADFAQYKTDVTAAFARLQASLDAALATQGGIPADVQAEIDATDAAIRGADTEANAEDPAPAEPPATDTGDQAPADDTTGQ